MSKTSHLGKREEKTNLFGEGGGEGGLAGCPLPIG